MKATIKTFPSDGGDCIFMKLENPDNGDSFHIMVDCGCLSKTIINYISKDLNNRIDLLIATHIDSDHIDGITSMFYTQELADLKINKILYNCYQKPKDCAIVPLNNDIKKSLDIISNIFNINVGSQISFNTSTTLAATILSKENLKQAWEQNAITENTDDLPLGDKWGNISFLSPTEKALENMYNLFKKNFASVTTTKIPDSPFDNIEDTYEMLIKIEESKKRPFSGKKIGYYDSFIDEESMIEGILSPAIESSITPQNKASIAFIWECRGHRVLFMGDAMCDIVVKNLWQKYHEEKIEFDAIKISHHGSKHNTSFTFSEAVDAPVFYVTGGENNIRPSQEALAKILMRKTTDDKPRILRYNIETDLLKELASDEQRNLRNKYNFKLINDNTETPYEFEY